MPKSRPIPATPWLPRWLLILYSTLTVCLIPWILLLSYELPTRHIFRNWGLAWVGFDILLCIVLAATAFLGYRRSHWVIMSASALTTLLLVDAWFDVLSSRPGPQLTFSLSLALAVELPLALLSLWLVIRVIGGLSRTKSQA